MQRVTAACTTEDSGYTAAPRARHTSPECVQLMVVGENTKAKVFAEFTTKGPSVTQLTALGIA